jgi:hypothetical protein
VDVIARLTDSIPATPGSSQTEYWDDSTAAALQGAGSYQAGAATVIVNWNIGQNVNWAHAAVSVADIGASTGGAAGVVGGYGLPWFGVQ